VIKPRVRKRDGRTVYDVRLRDSDGQIYSRTFDTKKAAEAYQDAQRATRRGGTWIDPRRAETSTASVADEWLASNATKRGGSLARDRSILQHHVTPVIGNKAIGAVTKADIQNKLVNDWLGKYAPSSAQGGVRSQA
jgi:hypothetical protein